MIHTKPLMFLIISSLLISYVHSIVHTTSQSPANNYKLHLKSYEAADKLHARIPDLSLCTDVTDKYEMYCYHLSKFHMLKLVQQEDLIEFMEPFSENSVKTINTRKSTTSKRAAVPWNLDRINQMSGVLDGSFRDDASVNVYILGSGIKTDHSEFDNRASVGFTTFPDGSDDCDGSGTMLASLVGGKSMGIARKANLIAVQVLDCSGSSNPVHVLNGIKYVKDQVLKHESENSARSLVLVGFTEDAVNEDLNHALVGLSETSEGILVVVGAGEENNHDACRTSPASAQGETALQGVVTIGATDEHDEVTSNIGECVDLFAPGENIPAAGINSPTDVTQCSGSLCAAALAAGVIARTIRENSKIDIEVQKSMLINGATIKNDIKLPVDTNYDLKNLKAKTPRKILYYVCGYSREEEPPVCESYNANCDNSKISTFDGNNVPLYQQRDKKCSFIIFQSTDGTKVLGSYHDCKLATYVIKWGDDVLDLMSGPKIIINNMKQAMIAIHYRSDTLDITHHLDAYTGVNEPLVIVSLKKAGEEQIKISYDGSSRLKITLMNYKLYSGKTGGLCGFYDGIGTNDYRLPDGAQLPNYESAYHKNWHTKQECRDIVCGLCEEPPCVACLDVAEQFCKEKFEGASNECLSGINTYKEKKACIEGVQKCCCQNIGNQPPSMDLLRKDCCQDSYFGNFERNREHCDFCQDHYCTKDTTHEHCLDDSGSKTKYDYAERVTYWPKDCCHYMDKTHTTQDCLAPRNDALMWNSPMPICKEKTCPPPDIPNVYTVISPIKKEYSCQEIVTIKCADDCYKINPSPQFITCTPNGGKWSNDAVWSDIIHPCEKITCPEPTLPSIRDTKGITDPLSWISHPIPHTNECGNTVTFECDECYTMRGNAEATCENTAKWTDTPRCMIKHCDLDTPSKPLEISVIKRRCNDTIEYSCNPDDGTPAMCYDLEGSPSRKCRVDGSGIAKWDADEPVCKLRYCPPLTTSTIIGSGFYEYRYNPANQYERIYLTATGSNSPTECNSKVHTQCEDCSYLVGPENRICQPNKKWSEDPPVCKKRFCMPPVNDFAVSHATYTPKSSSYECGSEVNFECSDCFEYNEGTQVHTCQPDHQVPFNPKDDSAKWDGNPYSCKIKHCAPIKIPDHGSISTDRTTCGTVVGFSCLPCYELDVEKTMKCQSDKSWSDTPPRCIKKQCTKPMAPIHGSVEVPDKIECGQEANFRCESCYEMVGSNTSKCQDNKIWDHEEPECKIWECPKRGNPENGDISNANFNMCGDDVTYTCDTCYTLVGENKAHCGPGGKWDHNPPVCERNTCKRPKVPPNTVLDVDKEVYLCGEFAKISCSSECHEPCDALANTTIYCLHDGWSLPEVPACHEKKCDLPSLLEVIDFGLTDYGLTYTNGMEKSSSILGIDETELKCKETLTYQCNECYNLKGPNSITCKPNKIWTEKPKCELRTCSAPEDTSQHLIYTEDKPLYSCGESITYGCPRCYSLIGEKERRCIPHVSSESGVWDKEAPICQINTCQPPNINDELLQHEGLYTCGSTVNYKCPDCFKLVGKSSAQCLETLEWSNDAPVCEPVCCPTLTKYTSEDPSYDVDIMTYTYKYGGDDEQKQFCSEDHVCQIVDAKCDDCYEYKVDGKTYDIAPRRECKYPENGEITGYWTNEREICSRKQCDPRTVEKSQHIQYKNENMAQKINCNDTVEFECKTCYESSDELKHNCTPQKRWNYPIPTCTLKECGELPIIENCNFTEGSSTCGFKRKLECDDCWYQNKCKEENPKHMEARCEDYKRWEWLVDEPEIKLKRCDAPPVIANANYSTNAYNDQFMCGNVIKYQCNECFKFEANRQCDCATVTCMGNNTADCTKGTWVGTFPTCVPITCSELPTPDNARTKQQNTDCGTKVEFECEEGYELVSGDAVRTCTTSGSWTGIQPVCKIRNCTALQPPINGYMSTKDRHYGTIVQFYCDSCFRFPEKMIDPNTLKNEATYPRYHILRCESSGNWNGSTPICRERYCGNPGLSENAKLIGDNFNCGATVTYTCNTGYYQYAGDITRSCGTDSKWSGELLECEAKTCLTPSDIDNGKYLPKNVSEYVYTSLVSYDCDVCYETSDDLDLVCEDNTNGDLESRLAAWNNRPPTCSRKTCPSLPKPHHGKMKVTGGGTLNNHCGRLVSVECQTGYRISTLHHKILCRANGKWTDVLPECKQICCPPPIKPENGIVALNNGKSCYGSTASYSCNRCFELVGGEAHQTCTEDGLWSDDEPVCKLIQCRDKRKVDHGSYTDKGSPYSCGTVRKFECYNGYELHGESEITCLENGEWSGNAPTCRLKQCPKDDVYIEHGYHYIELEDLSMDPDELDSLPTWAVVYFECEDEYELIGREDIFCNQDGTWSDPTPSCVKKTCLEPPEIENGFMEYTNLKEGGIVTYHCDTCYQLAGDDTAECKDESWTLDPPECIEKMCYPPAVEDNSKIDTEKDEYSCGEMVSYSCDEGYKLHGSEVSTCTSNRTWTTKAPVCADITCEKVAPLKNGQMKSSKTVNGRTAMFYSCDTGYKLHGDAAVICVKGQWQGVHAICSKEICGDPGIPVFGSRTGDSFEYEDIVIFKCDEGYQLRGTRQIQCQYDGTWSFDTPECVCNECPRLKQPVNGYIKTANSNSYNSVIEYSCNTGYEVVGQNTRTCLASGLWSSYEPICERINCTVNIEIPQLATITMDGNRYGDIARIKCPGQTGHFRRKCQSDGTWSDIGSIPSKCECKMIKKWTKVLIDVPVPKRCIFGKCFGGGTRKEETMVERIIEKCS